MSSSKKPKNKNEVSEGTDDEGFFKGRCEPLKLDVAVRPFLGGANNLFQLLEPDGISLLTKKGTKGKKNLPYAESMEFESIEHDD